MGVILWKRVVFVRFIVGGRGCGVENVVDDVRGGGLGGIFRIVEARFRQRYLLLAIVCALYRVEPSSPGISPEISTTASSVLKTAAGSSTVVL